MSLSLKLSIGIWALGILACVCAAVGVSWLNTADAARHRAAFHAQQAHHASAVSAAAEDLLQNIGWTLASTPGNGDPAELLGFASLDPARARVHSALDSWWIALERSAPALDAHAADVEREHVPEMQATWRQLDNQIIRLVAGAQLGLKPEELIVQARAVHDAYEGALGPALDLEHARHDHEAIVARTSANRASELGKLALVMVGVGSIVLAILFQLGTWRDFTGRAKRMRDEFNRFSASDSPEFMVTSARDELDQLAVACERIASELHTASVARDHVDRIVQSMIDSMIVLSPEGIIESVNPATREMLSFADGELTDKPISSLVFAEGGESFFTPSRLEYLKLRGNLRDQRVLYRARFGEEVQMSMSASVVQASSGEGARIVLQGRDMRRLEKLFEEIHDARRFNEGIVRTMPSALLVLDADGKVLRTNPAFTQIFGSSGLDADLRDYLPHPEVGRALQDARAGRVVSFEVDCNLPAQANARLAITVTSLEAERESAHLARQSSTGLATRMHYLLVIGDVTERMRLLRDLEAKINQLEDTQTQLLQSEKMAAIGTLAGGISHDFKNLLTVILGYNEILQKRLDSGRELSGSSLSRSAEQISKAGRRATQLVRQLLAFSRKQETVTENISLTELVDEMLGMLKPLIGENIQLVPELGQGVDHVHADPGQFQQVLLNLVVNARDAMPDGGRITIGTRNVTLQQPIEDNGQTIPAGSYVALSVADTGCGIPPEKLDRIFEPFFTTKSKGQGTGLGLATVKALIEQHQGVITVESHPRHGTTFRVYLPRVEAAPPQEVQDTSRLELPIGNETILIAEDEQAVRSFAFDLLSAHGYQVHEAADGQEALALAAAFEGEIHLLVTDIVMPRLGGRELASKLSLKRPGLSVLFMSGYTEAPISKTSDDVKAFEFLAKPFTARALVRAVRRLLDDHAGVEVTSSST